MTCRTWSRELIHQGIARGRTIELEEPLPFAEGEPVSVSVELRHSSSRGSARAVRDAMLRPPHLLSGIVDELEAAVEAGKLPPSDHGVFDDPR